jgi:hypothetical protein
MLRSARAAPVAACVPAHPKAMSSTTEPQMNRRSLAIVIALVSVCLCVGVTVNTAPQFFKSDLTLHATETAAGGRGGEKTTTVTTYMSGGVFKRSSSDGTDSIIRLDEGKMVSIDNNKKTYSEVTFQELQALMDKAGAATQNMPPEAMAQMQKMMGGAAAPVTVTKAGAGEPIAGYPTERWVVTGPMAMEIWAAPDLKVPPQYYDVMKARMPANPLFDMGKVFEEMKKIGGFALKQTTTMKIMNMETKSTMVVTAVDKTPIAKTTFDVPAGYKKVDFMQK